MSLKLTTVCQSSRLLNFERFHITDRYWRDNPSVRTLIADVKGVTNRSMICSRDWEIHYPQLDRLYGNAQHTIHAVTEAIVAWCEAIIGLVTDESNWKWKNELIRNVDRRNKRIRLKIKVSRSALQGQDRKKKEQIKETGDEMAQCKLSN